MDAKGCHVINWIFWVRNKWILHLFYICVEQVYVRVCIWHVDSSDDRTVLRSMLKLFFISFYFSNLEHFHSRNLPVRRKVVRKMHSNFPRQGEIRDTVKRTHSFPKKLIQVWITSLLTYDVMPRPDWSTRTPCGSLIGPQSPRVTHARLAHWSTSSSRSPLRLAHWSAGFPRSRITVGALEAWAKIQGLKA